MYNRIHHVPHATYMITLHACASLSSIVSLKSQYIQRLTAPLDGMWEVGIIGTAPHWEIQSQDQTIGYCAIDEHGMLLQFFLLPGFEKEGQKIFNSVLTQRSVAGAFASTIDPFFLSLCLDLHSDISVHTIIYELERARVPAHPGAKKAIFRKVEGSELDLAVAFQQRCLGAGPELGDWLRGYSSNLIAREELFVLCNGEGWMGLGEYRKSDTQDGVVDLGMMVDPDERGKGWATNILSRLVEGSDKQGHTPICSTTVENTASQKAITRAGFVGRHRIVKVSFQTQVD